MRIWFPAIRTGSGSDIFTIQLAEGLKKQGVDTTITWFPHGFELAPHLLYGVRTPPNTDIIHANSWSGFAFKRNGIPLVVTVHHCVHDPDYAPYRSLLQTIYHSTLIYRYEWSSFAAATTITSVSHFTSKRVSRSFPGANPTAIHTGIDTEFFTPAEEGLGLQATARPFRLLFVGNPTRRKGFDLALAVTEQLDPREFELRYTLGLRGSLNIKRSGVRCLGRLDRLGLLRAYRECDALLFPSRYEGFGLAACEAMACGKPVIASDREFTSEIIGHEQTGILCSFDNVDSFVNAVHLLASDRKLAKNIGLAGRGRIIEEFGTTQMVSGYMALYSRLLAV